MLLVVQGASAWFQAKPQAAFVSVNTGADCGCRLGPRGAS
jgi:hypothetical protein